MSHAGNGPITGLGQGQLPESESGCREISVRKMGRNVCKQINRLALSTEIIGIQRETLPSRLHFITPFVNKAESRESILLHTEWNSNWTVKVAFRFDLSSS